MLVAEAALVATKCRVTAHMGLAGKAHTMLCAAGLPCAAFHTSNPPGHWDKVAHVVLVVMLMCSTRCTTCQ